MAYVYKQFTAQDKALIPFNAHKQYNFTSASAASNSVSYFSGRWTSESYSTYSSGSASADINANVIKYNQIDKLYYRNYLTQIHDKLGPIKHSKQRRELYEKVNILSIPMGLYGNEIKPSSFYLSASKSEIIDDKFGNLIISGTITSSYPNDVNENVFRLDPVEGFKKYDLGVHEGYKVVSLKTADTTPNDYDTEYYSRGERITVNIPTKYSTNDKAPINFYSEKFDKDNSFFANKIRYNNVTFNTSSLGSISHKFPKITFQSPSGSFVSSSHKKRFNFNGDEDFSISFWIKPKGVPVQEQGINNSTIENGFIVEGYQPQEMIDNRKRYILSKSRIKTSPTLNSDNIPEETPSELQFPYEIYMQSSSLFFSISDGNETKTITTKITGSYINNFAPVHILCQNSGSTMQLYRDAVLQSSTTISFKKQTRNTANLYIASSGENTTIDQSGGIAAAPNSYYDSGIGSSIIGIASSTAGQVFTVGAPTLSTPTFSSGSSIENGFVVGNYVGTSQNFHRHFNGDLNNINIWSRAYNETTITNISESINASPYIGNVFYQNGFATITHPSHHDILNKIGVGELAVGPFSNLTSFELNTNEQKGINTLQFQGTHLIYEHEYQCTVHEHEFNNTTNLSVRKNNSSTSHELADFATGSLFKPHITTIGLYNDRNELLVIGKLAQAVRSSDETDTTFVVRWDT